LLFVRRMRAIAIAVLFAAACSSADQSAAPTLTITAPDRGTMASGPVTVTGTVTNATQVFVNGAQVTLAADGTFSTSVTFDPGIGIIETHAINGATDIKDVRAVLSGNTAPTDGSVKAPLAAHASVTALKSIGAAMATEAKAIDYTAAAQAMNPVYNNTGCLGAQIDITSIDLSTIGVGLTPAANTIGTDVTISNVVVKLHADFKVACIGGSTTITVTSSAAHLHGALGVAVANKAVATSVGAVTVTLDNFSMDVGGVPGAIEDLFNSIVRGKVEAALTTMIHDNVPTLANHALAGLVAKPLSVNVLGKMTAWTAVPTKVSVAADGLMVAVDTTVKVTDGTGAMALAQPTPVNDDMVSQSTGIGLALATDAINQMFGGLWAAGALDKSMPMSSLGALGAVLDSNATTVEIKMMLPSTVTTGDDGLSLAVGDLILTTKDDAGNAVQTFALSVKTTLAANPSQLGKLLLTLGTPDIHAQIIAQSEVVTRPLTDDLVTGIVQSVWTIVDGTVDDALSNLPMPAFAGIQLGAPAIKGAAGFVVADIAVN
jgi:Glucodextranase, domain B